ncbi:GntR family transcriptional regulator [Eubacterium sp. 1001713B170207_170306_E7]|uniref:GntR family transcriptional regulator n=1 Tax=Eubacterium sp. 1001713B170207_170306_E7 TaxID=2787097 RepID=UPI001899ECD2|nr:GntR family transcriptional regulator [Eubacterium sp. 1001713B170207_170306_E7]
MKEAYKEEKSLTEQVYSKIKERILTLDYPPGIAITEANLAEEFSVSRMPVHIAIQKLTNEGWIETGFRKKVYVKGISVKDVREIYEIREILEIKALDTIFKKELNWDFSFKLEEKFVRMKASYHDYYAFEYADSEVHRTMVSVLDNKRIDQIYLNLQDELVRIMVLIFKYRKKNNDYAERIIASMQKIILGIREKNYDEALFYLQREHLSGGLDEALEAVTFYNKKNL